MPTKSYKYIKHLAFGPTWPQELRKKEAQLEAQLRSEQRGREQSQALRSCQVPNRWLYNENRKNIL